MVKAADALVEAGHDVRLVCTRFVAWAAEADRELVASRRWQARVVDFERASAPIRSRYVGARRRLARGVVSAVGVDSCPWWAVPRAYGYVHPELVKAALAEPADFFYGGTTGALAAVAEAAQRAGKSYGLDLEDLHTAESDEYDAPMQHGLARRVLTRVLPPARFATTSSVLLAEAYRQEFGVEPTVVHNVFPLPSEPPPIERPDGGLKLYWFSQTIGRGRGLEEAIVAVGEADIDARLTLRGRGDPAYLADLGDLAARRARRLTLDVQPPIAPDRLIADARQHDVGLCGELATVKNRRLCLANKIFTYLAAGLAVAVSETPAHLTLAAELGEAAWFYRSGDTRALARALRRLATSPGQLNAARRASWAAARRRWHWEHEFERGALVRLVERHLRPSAAPSPPRWDARGGGPGGGALGAPGLP
jgi:glycosyltransferase involved in cell wall biosynthesis